MTILSLFKFFFKKRRRDTHIREVKAWGFGVKNDNKVLMERMTAATE